MTQTTSETITVEDVAGAKTLPVGTILDEQFEFRSEVTSEGRFKDLVSGFEYDAEVLFLPATILNPEILGAFTQPFAEVDSTGEVRLLT